MRIGGRAMTANGPQQRAGRRRADMAPRPHALLAAVAAALVMACGGFAEDDWIACTTEMRSSVIVNVVDAAGTPLTGATVTYRVDGGPVRTATCHEPPSACSTFAAGEELSGEFSVTAERSRFQPASATVKVERDVCHVQTQRLTLTLRPG